MTTTTRRNRLPSLASIPVQEAPCHKCSALCCRYFALQIDTPEDAEDFDSIKWYLIHEDTWVWVDDNEWYVQVDRKCKHLQSNNLCGIYETRPQICRDLARGSPECEGERAKSIEVQRPAHRVEG